MANHSQIQIPLLTFDNTIVMKLIYDICYIQNNAWEKQKIAFCNDFITYNFPLDFKEHYLSIIFYKTLEMFDTSLWVNPKRITEIDSEKCYIFFNTEHYVQVTSKRMKLLKREMIHLPDRYGQLKAEKVYDKSVGRYLYKQHP